MATRKSLSLLGFADSYNGVECSAYKIILVVLLMFIVAAPMTAAMDIDNVKNSKNILAGEDFNLNGKAIEHNPIWNEYSPIEIKNLFGLGKTLFQGAITQHDEICGSDCNSTMEIYLAEDSVLIDAVNFYTILKDGSRVKQDVRSYQFYVNNNPYELGTVITAGTYEVRLEAEKKPSRRVDWVIETQGEVLDEWAIWNSPLEFVIDENLATVYSGTTQTGYVLVKTFTVNDYVNYTNGSYKITAPAICGIKNTYTYEDLTTENVERSGATGGVFESYNLTNPNKDKKVNTIHIYLSDASGSSLPQYICNEQQTRVYGGANTVTLNSPVDNYTSSTNEVEFNCSADIIGGANLTNMSIFTNASGSWGIKNTIQLSSVEPTVQSAPSTTTGTAVTGKAGIKFVANSNIDMVSATKHASSTATMAYLEYENHTIIDQKTFSGNTVTFDTPISLIEGDTYYIMADKEGASYTRRSGATAYPISLTYINWTAGANPGDQSVGVYNFVSILIQGNNYLSGNNYTALFTLDISEETLWTCSAGDSDGDTGFALENRTVLLDTIPPAINITYPIGTIDYAYLGQNFSLNWTVSDAALAQCWYNYNNTNTTVTCTDQNTSFILTDQKDITFYANDSVANEGNFTRSWTYKLFENSQTYNSTTYETSAEGFKLNLTSDGTQLVLADLVYDGTTYTATKTGNNSEMEFNRNLIIPTIDISTAQNKSFYWNVTYGSEVFPTETNNQSVGRIALGLCNATLTVPYINFTFEDEETAISTNATIDTSTWNYYLASGDGTVNKTLLYSTTSENESYKFCFNPSDRTVTSELELQYSGSGYPQRRWSTSGSLTNLTFAPTLYMLASADGTYSVYQVQSTVGNGIEGVAVEAERQFDGVWTLVEQGVTDSAGGFTGWLNPDYDHKITFTKSGYTTIQVTVRPSSSTYTVVMSGEDGEAVYNSSQEGMTWVVYPNLGQILLPNTTQTFSFNITANYSNLVLCKMEIINNDSISLGTTTGCNAQGGNLSLIIPLGNNKSVRAIYSIDIGEGFFILDADAYWVLMVINIPDRGTLTSFFTHLRDLNEFGSDNNRQEFSRIVFFYLILAIVMASISRATNWDLINIGGSLVFMNFIIIFGSYAGFLTLSYTFLTPAGPNPWMDQYVVALITSLFTAGFVFNKLEGRV